MLGTARVAAFWIGFLVLAVVCHVYRFVLILVPGVVSRRYRRRYYRTLWNVVIRFWGRSVYALCRFVAGMRSVVVEGTVPAGRCVVVANHQSTADIPVLFEVLRDKNVKFIVKKELLRSIPFASTAMSLEPRQPTPGPRHHETMSSWVCSHSSYGGIDQVASSVSSDVSAVMS